MEVHLNPEKALSDGAQSLKPERFAELVRQARAIAEDVDRMTFASGCWRCTCAWGLKGCKA
jgi:3-deoxy-D-manno-octulosonic acid (KDO) 8-phosphate synthase